MRQNGSQAEHHTFVVLAYGTSPFLAHCLASLNAQATPSRILVSTSTPSDFIVAAAHEAGAAVVINPDRRGIGADWNFGLRAAGTRYVTLAHQDDSYDALFLARSLALFEGCPEGALTFTGYREITDDGVPRVSKLTVVKALIKAGTIGRRERLQGGRLRMFLSFGCPLPCSSVTFDRERLRGFAFAEDLATNLDWEAWWRLARAGEVFLHAAEPLVGRRYNELTETSKGIREGHRLREDAAMFAAIWPRPIGRAMALLYRAGY